jgi:hypothetical protein
MCIVGFDVNHGASCGIGFHTITDGWEQCLDASNELPMWVNAIYMVSGAASSSYPQGCFRIKGNQEIYFNPSSVENVEEGHQLICKSGTYLY